MSGQCSIDGSNSHINAHESFKTSIESQRKHLEKLGQGKITLYFDYQNVNSPLIIMST